MIFTVDRPTANLQSDLIFTHFKWKQLLSNVNQDGFGSLLKRGFEIPSHVGRETQKCQVRGRRNAGVKGELVPSAISQAEE